VFRKHSKLSWLRVNCE